MFLVAAIPATHGAEVFAWGDNQNGQCNVPPGLSNVVAIAGGYIHSLALKGNGTVVAWGNNQYGQCNVPTNLTHVAFLAQGYGLHNLVLKEDGTVVAWGNNDYGQCNVPADLTNVIGVAVGYVHSLAVRRDGTVAAWGRNVLGECNVPAGLTNAVAVAAGTWHSLALRRDGTVVAWGYNNAGQATVPSNVSNVVAIAAGIDRSLALKGDGTVVAWGYTHLPAMTNVFAIASGPNHNLAVTRDGAIVTWGDNTYGQTNIPAGLPNAGAVAGGAIHSLALKKTEVRILVNSAVATGPVTVRGPAEITLVSPLPSGTVFYTLDGSDPTVAGLLYSDQIRVQRTATLRVIAYDATFTKSVRGGPLTITILPTLDVVTVGGGSAAIEPPSGDYLSNSLAVVTATPEPGWSFLQWLGDAEGTNPAVQVTATRDKTLKAVFGTPISTNVVGSGTILISPSAAQYPCGSTLRLTAVPQPGNYFVQWSTAASGTNNPLAFTLTTPNPTITAVFASLSGPQFCALTVIPDGDGRVDITPPGNRFLRGTNITLMAVPDAGQDFVGWSGAASGAQNPLVFTINSNKVITANFTKRPRLQGQGEPAWLREDGFRLTLTGEFGERYRIDGATNLPHWTPLITLTNHYGTVQFTDPLATNAPQRFYRAVLVP